MEIKTRKGEKILVSECDYEHLKQFKWNINNKEYVNCHINKKLWRIHRYIFIEILGNKDLTRHHFIDHINNNKLDNRRENLRVVTAAENNRNRNKTNNTSSKYYGVCKINENNFRTTFILNDENKSVLEHAAYQWNLWIEKYKIIHSKKNNVDKPDNFIEYKNERVLPKNITIKNNKYRVKYKSIYYGVYKTLGEAKLKLKNVKEEVELIRIEKINNKPIKQNENCDCIIELFNNKKEKVAETIVDEENYYDLMKYSWSLHDKNYVSGTINKIKYLIHRFIMNYTGDNYVDHINGNKLDNRKCNLRIITPHQNSMNCSSSKNGTSKYIGVHFNKRSNKWLSQITINGKCKKIGLFKNEIDAAKARDIATREHFGEFGKLNFLE